MKQLFILSIFLLSTFCAVQVPKSKATKVNCTNNTLMQCINKCVADDYYKSAYTLADRIIVCENKCKTCKSLKKIKIGF